MMSTKGSLIKIHPHGFWEGHTTCEETFGTLFGQSSQEVRAARLLGASAFPFKINQSTNRCPLFPTDRWGSGLANCTESDFPSFWTLNVVRFGPSFKTVLNPILVGGCTTHFRTYFRGDWDVHWGYLILTQGHLNGKEVCSLFLTQEVGNG